MSPKYLTLLNSSLLLVLSFLLCPGSSSAQFSINFSSDKNGGCAPLPVKFTSELTGASAGAVYSWDFGNGNRSALPNPGAVFEKTGIFTVTLTVNDGAVSQSVSKQIEITPPPAATFALSVAKGCAPLDVSFTATTASGAVTSYTWDFGDGNVQQSAGPTSSHTYVSEQKPMISLTVSNSYGCAQTFTRENLINVLKPVEAAFKVVQTVLCRETEPLQLVNNSTGPGTLTYLWDFGDGTTSTMPAPAHVFNKKGLYTVQLTTSSSEGCTARKTQDELINVATFKTDFSVPATLCVNPSWPEINNTSSPVASHNAWIVDGVPYAMNTGNTFYVTFFKEGEHVIKLVNQFGACLDSITKVVVVNPAPKTDGIIAELQPNCGLPVTCKFNNEHSDAVKWQWNFGIGSSDSVHSVMKAPTYDYMYDGRVYVWVNLVTAAGCSAMAYKELIVEPFKVDIAIKGGQTNCGPFDLGFSAVVVPSTDSIIAYQWDFGDGGSSTLAEPIHHYAVPGTYITTLLYKTRSGCSGTQYFRDIIVYSKPSAEFTTASTTVCGNTQVNLDALYPAQYQQYVWTIGNEIVYGSEVQKWTFSKDTTYTIGLVVTNQGGCTDTVIKENFITVKLPFTYIKSWENTCEGTRGLVSFSQETEGATSWQWNFGDGSVTTLLADKKEISHVYTATGAYYVTLSTTNGSCTSSDTRIIHVLVKQRPQLTSTITSVCADGEVPVMITGLDINPANQWSTNYYRVGGAIYNDGSPFHGSISDDNPYGNWGVLFQGKMHNFEAGKSGLKIILYAWGFSCPDTTTLMPLAIRGSIAAFEVLQNDVCYKTPIIIRDTSKTNAQILSWQWNFGDGTSTTSDKGGTISHVYPYPGQFNIGLTLTDNMGCRTNSYLQTRAVVVRGPKADFRPSNSSPPITLPVEFYNFSNPGNTLDTKYHWSFGDGGTSLEPSPVHTYATPGQHVVRLVASSLSSGCADTMTQIISVKNFNPAFFFTTENIGADHCPPLMVRFTNTSSGYTHFSWDFGDGFSADNMGNPAHIYDKPGRYLITLSLYGEGGLTATYLDSVIIRQPTAAIRVLPRHICQGETANFLAVSNNGGSFLWDFGDGTLMAGSSDDMLHVYNTAGLYKPIVLLVDTNGCHHAAAAVDSISVRPKPLITFFPGAPRVCFGSSITLGTTGGVTFNWSPASSLNDPTISAPVATPLITTTYSLSISDDLGCKNTDSVTVTVITAVPLRLSRDTSICFGESIQLVAAGKETYHWIGPTAGLSNTTIGSPLATPKLTATYTVVGSDLDKCFVDTAHVVVTVHPLPTVFIPPVPDIMLGEAVPLTNVTSSDVVKWSWSPGDYLNCMDCSLPVSRPLKDIRYTLNVANNAGCTASANVLITLQCKASSVFIPTAFSPNNDGLNDQFSIKGISIVKYLVIYGRYGNVIHERRNFLTASQGAAWDGNFKGAPQPAGAYTWFAEMECATGGVFSKKGTVLLLR